MGLYVAGALEGILCLIQAGTLSLFWALETYLDECGASLGGSCRPTLRLSRPSTSPSPTNTPFSLQSLWRYHHGIVGESVEPLNLFACIFSVFLPSAALNLHWPSSLTCDPWIGAADDLESIVRFNDWKTASPMYRPNVSDSGGVSTSSAVASTNSSTAPPSTTTSRPTYFLPALEKTSSQARDLDPAVVNTTSESLKLDLVHSVAQSKVANSSTIEPNTTALSLHHVEKLPSDAAIGTSNDLTGLPAPALDMAIVSSIVSTCPLLSAVVRASSLAARPLFSPPSIHPTTQSTSPVEEERVKKLMRSVLVVGGGLLMRGASKFLQERVYQAFYQQLQPSPPIPIVVEVLSSPRDLDARVIVWKGGSVYARVDSSWISRRDWMTMGENALSERLGFVWWSDWDWNAASFWLYRRFLVPRHFIISHVVAFAVWPSNTLNKVVDLTELTLKLESDIFV